MSTAPNDMLVFDRRTVRHHRDRAARTMSAADFLFAEIAARLADAIADVNRDFPLSLDLGSHDGPLGRALLAGGKVGTLVSADLSSAQVQGAPGLRLAADEEWLPFAPATFDMIASAGSLHWVNDLPGCLVQLRDALKPDGFLALAMLGGGTLTELRQSFLAAEALIEGGSGLHVSPFVDLRDAAGLMQRAGFAMPVADLDTITVTYDNAFALCRDLRAMGEQNALVARRKTPIRRDTLMALVEDYQTRFTNPDGRIYATFEVVTLTAWAPAPGQPRPKRRGSATHSLAKALGTHAETP